MKQLIRWLGRNKTIAVMLAIIVYFSIVTFHDEVTRLAIKMRNAIGRDHYNSWLAWFFLILLLIFIAYFVWKIYRGNKKWLNITLSVLVTGLMVFSFRLLMVYNIEAIHFVYYALLAIILLPVLRSYGETVFWVTILGILDELFQYTILDPSFEYFDFNDIVLNLVGAAAGVIMVHALDGNVVEMKKFTWYKSPAILTGMGLLILFILLLLTGKMTINPAGMADSGNWFSLNREFTRQHEFWKEAYPGRWFHILRPAEGIVLIYLLFAGFFTLDVIRGHSQKSAASAFYQ